MNYTYQIPHILIESRLDANGRVVRVIREGGMIGLDAVTDAEISETVKDEKPFRIVAQNQINFGGQTISVLNDETDIGGQYLAPSSPTASEYLAQAGKKTMIAFSCRPNASRTPAADATCAIGPKKWTIGRTFITLP